jgi:uncharacterized protein
MRLPVLAAVAHSPPVEPRLPVFHVLTKPIGPICNLDCKYCFYLEKEKLYPDQRRWRMPDDVLEGYIRQYIRAQPGQEVNFAWQGGEPTLLGVPFFEQVISLQLKHAGGKRIHNALQTNGTLLDDEWCQFLAKHDFLVGLSIDGPRDIHDRYRLDKQQAGTFDAVMRGLRLLRKHGVSFHTLTVVSRANQDRPLDVYRFLKDVGSTVLQFIPLVERLPTESHRRLGLSLAAPPALRDRDTPAHDSTVAEESLVTEWSVQPAAYGRFLRDIFDFWVRHDVGRTYVQLFDVMLGIWSGLESPLCVFKERCGTALAMEHNGDVYSCDHFVYPQYRLGNLLTDGLESIVGSDQQRRFGEDKFATLPKYCRNCEVRFACNGECPKKRFLVSPDGEPGLNYLCAGYKLFLKHIDPYMRVMAGAV